jgi:beta-glucanase (GH16 family)
VKHMQNNIGKASAIALALALSCAAVEANAAATNISYKSAQSTASEQDNIIAEAQKQIDMAKKEIEKQRAVITNQRGKITKERVKISQEKENIAKQREIIASAEGKHQDKIIAKAKKEIAKSQDKIGKSKEKIEKYKAIIAQAKMEISVQKDIIAQARDVIASTKDSDKDGVANNIDLCPETPVGEVVDEDGCTLPPESDWSLVWSDEFDGSAIDTSKWSHEVNCNGGGNNEQQCYTDSTENSYVDDGLLNIVALPAPAGSPLPYTSARLRTLNKGDWTYGRFEIRAKLPQGQGSWPAIWMLPTDWVYGGWAASGEIDIVEAVNLKTQSDAGDAQPGELESRVHGTLHYGKSWPENVSSGTDYKFPADENPADIFHTYALEWQEGEMRWYIDGEHYATQEDSGWYSQYAVDGELVTAPGSAPFNQNFHMLLNLAVGGSWAANVNEKGIDSSVFPQTLNIDYVRVYECSIQPNTGAGCATIGDNAEFVEGHPAPEIVIPDDTFAPLPEFYLYEDSLAQGLLFNSYNPDSAVSFQEVFEGERGDVLQISKTGANGNVYFEYPPHADLSDWLAAGELVFDLNIVSTSGAELLVKLDSGWPNVSDYSVPLPAVGEWVEVRINIATLLANGNRFSPGASADITDIANVLVIEPLGAMELKFDNIRFVENDTPPVGGTGQIDLPINFDQADINYTMTDFGGAVTELTINPDGSDRVAKTTKTAGAATWAGTTMSTALGLATAIPVTTSDSVMKVWVYAPSAGIPVRLKLEDHNDVTHTVESETLTTLANTWEEMSFDFNNEAPGTEPLIHPEWIFDKASIFFNFGSEGANDVYYWDEVSFAGGTTGGGGGSGSASTDFEADAASYLFSDFDGGAVAIIDNPGVIGANGIENTSTGVAQMLKFAGQPWGGSTYILDGAVDVVAGTVFTMQVYAQRPVPVLFKIMEPNTEATAQHSGNGWEELSFDFGDTAVTITAITLIFDNGVVGDAAGDPANWTFYFDDIVQGAGNGGGPTDPEPTDPTQMDLPLDFESDIIDYVLQDFGGTYSLLVGNPNGAGTVAMTTKPLGAATWAGTTMGTNAGFASPIPVTTSNSLMKVWVYSPDAGIPVRLKLEDHNDVTHTVETETLTTVANNWEELTFDFTNEAAGTEPLIHPDWIFDKASIFFNFGTDGDVAGEKAYYWDNVSFGN